MNNVNHENPSLTRRQLLRSAIAPLVLASGGKALPPIAECRNGDRKGSSLLLVGINTSKSARPQLPGWVRTYAVLDRKLRREPLDIRMYRMDRTSAEFSRGPIRGNPELLTRRLRADLARMSERDNTYSLEFWRLISKAVSKPQAGTVLIVFTDGFSENEPASYHRETNQIAADLAKSHALSAVAIVGVDPRIGAEVQADLKPLIDALGGHFMLRFAHDQYQADVLALIQKTIRR